MANKLYGDPIELRNQFDVFIRKIIQEQYADFFKRFYPGIEATFYAFHASGTQIQLFQNKKLMGAISIGKFKFGTKTRVYYWLEQDFISGKEPFITRVNRFVQDLAECLSSIGPKPEFIVQESSAN